MVHSVAQEVSDVSTESVILSRAADLIAPQGKWMRGHLCGDEKGRPLRGAVTGADFCSKSWSLVGSLQKAGWLQARDDEQALRDRAEKGAYVRLISYHRLVPALGRIIADTLGLERTEQIVDWEDEKGRTQAEVVAALRAAAEKARTAVEADSVGTEAEGRSEPNPPTQSRKGE